MRSKTAKWFECSIRYEKIGEDGLQKKVTEQYVLDALSYGEAEARIIGEMSKFISGEFEVKTIKEAPYKEVFFMNVAETVLASEEEKLSRAVNKGRDAAMEQYDKPVDYNPYNADTRWYRAKLQFITVDEKTERERRSNVTYLVEACSLHNALDNIDTVMKGTMIDYVQANVGETAIIDVFEHEEKKEEPEHE